MLKGIVIGNITADAMIKSVNGGNEFVTFTVASNRSYTNAQGMKVEVADFIDIVKNPSGVDPFLTKGTQVYVEGNISCSAWSDNQGQLRASMQINAREVQLLGSKKDNNQNQQPYAAQ